MFEEHKYKSAKTVIHILIDVVSKNGNLCLNIPLRGDGTIDEDERNVVLEIGQWMKINSEAIYNTRPWTVFGEGPAQESAAPLSAQGFNEGGGKPFSALDYRFTTKGNSLYVIGLGWPENGKTLIKSLSMGNPMRLDSINRIELLGAGELKFVRKEDGLEVILPSNRPELNYAYVLKIN
ncbi:MULTISPECIES: alpha-L-fucosidase [unclassified Flavobacterium]|uniref:alpha-L-fucosidase n=1 Tax=unclassified Flavobacterium TaxID=196869 RepID=UPI0025C55F7A|nr:MULTISPECIES: alpha-L-fucosidase [unclassified Flavobacterium]